MSDALNCLDDGRRRRLRRAATAYAVDSVRYRPGTSPPELLVVLSSHWTDADLDAHESGDRTLLQREQIAIEGGTRIKGLRAVGLRGFKNDLDWGGAGTFVVELDGTGDPSTYRLRLIRSASEPHAPPDGFDRRSTEAEFRFCQAGVVPEDCSPPSCPPPLELPVPPIDYLAKDYASFRRLILDRLSQTVPEWTERNAADLGVTLAEVLAYHADHLSYLQDAIGTEAYLGTARRRLSVRRHARLVDYRLHEGSNARAWVFVEVGKDFRLKDVRHWTFFTGRSQAPTGFVPPRPHSKQDLLADPDADRIVFEPLLADPQGSDGSAAGDRVVLRPAHNRIRIHTWGDRECCLSQGATSASLVDEDLSLAAGDLLLFEEVQGPATGHPADADPRRRHVVRLTRVRRSRDDLPNGAGNTPGDAAAPAASGKAVLEVEWDQEDALPFSLCVSTRCRPDVSIARGNLLLVDHGLSIESAEPILVKLPEKPKDDVSACDPPTLGASPRTAFVGAIVSVPLGDLDGRRLTHVCPYPSRSAQARFQSRELARWLTEAVAGRSLFRRYLTAARKRPRPSDVISDDPQAAARADRALVAKAEETVREILKRGAAMLSRARAGRAIRADDSQVRWINEKLRGAAETGPECTAIENFLLDLNWTGPASHDFDNPPHEASARFQLVEVARAGIAGRPHAAGSVLTWETVPDLLASGSESRHFVLETDDAQPAGSYLIRFGDDRHGAAPASGTAFQYRCRIGNGIDGNVGPESIQYVVGSYGGVAGVRSVRNPLAARGGRDPESTAEARLHAPQRFRTRQLRAVTRDDYARLAEQDRRVQRAMATSNWTGTGTFVRVAVDLHAVVTRDSPDPLLAERMVCEELENRLQRFRLAGHDVAVVPARYVPLLIRLRLCLRPSVDPGSVRRVIRERLGAHERRDGQKGFFHPDRLTFGQPIEASAIVDEVQNVAGVDAVRLEVLRRLFDEGGVGHLGGTLPIGPLEIARLDNDPAFPENGRLELLFGGDR